MLKKIDKWLKDPKRKYADGLAIFNELASKKQKTDFGEFLNKGAADTQFDAAGRFPILINQVAFIMNKVRSNPTAFVAVQTVATKTKAPAVKVINTGEESEKGQAVITDPPAQIDINSLPEELSAERDRLKEIVPIMAKLHADMSDEKIADDKRAAIRAELVKLDDERRAIWNKIESFDPNIEKNEEEKQVELNMFELGRQTTLRIGQLKYYITRNKEALAKFEAENNEKKAANARGKVELYEKELAELESLFKKE